MEPWPCKLEPAEGREPGRPTYSPPAISAPSTSSSPVPSRGFHTVPHPGEFGYEAGRRMPTRVGGINVNDMSLDAARGIIYAPTGRRPYDHGADRIGANLWQSPLFPDAHGQTAVALPGRASRPVTRQHGASTKLVCHNGRNGRGCDGGQDGLLHPTASPASRRPIEERKVPLSDMPGEQSRPTQPFPTVAAVRPSVVHGRGHQPVPERCEREKWMEMVRSSVIMGCSRRRR